MSAMEQEFVPVHEVRAELERILASPDFAASHQLASFLQYIVLESLAGRGDLLKERNVAIGALGRDADFDPRLDCVVRVVAGKLRRAVERFYAQHGSGDAVCIDVPKGSYAPIFRHATAPSNGHSPNANTFNSSGESRPTIAVMPLRSFTGGAQERFLADLLTDDVVLRFSRLHWLKVIDCLATASSDIGAVDPCAIAARLHADFVFAGTVSRVAGCIRLTVRLIDVANGELAWVDQYDREIDDGPLAQQDDIADRIASGVATFFAAAV